MTPYLNRPLRPQHEVVRDILANCAESYLVVDLAQGEPYFREEGVGMTLAAIVRNIAAGEYDFKHEAPLAVVRISFRDNEAEIVTEDVARAVGEYIAKADGSEWRECPFLDQVWPEWKQEQRRVA